LFFGASENTLPYAHDYMSIILLGNVVTHMFFGLNAILRSSGHPKRSMQATVLSVAINAVLDALFIFGFDWGIAGAAWATVIAQICALIWQLNIFRNPNELIHFRRGIYHLDWHLINEMTAIGLSPFLMNLSSSVIVIAINQSLARTGGDMAIGAYGIINRIFFVAAMIVMGINQGMQPIAGYNFGARLSGREMEVLKLSIIAATTVTTTVFLLAQFCPEILAKLFTTDTELISIASQGMRLVCLVFPVVGFQMVTSIFFQSIGIAKKAIFLSLTRQLIFLLPGLLIFSRIYGTVGVWISFPIADSLASLISAYMLWKEFKILKQQGLVKN
ncbi:MAG: MATE family efflux transporter, partial [Bacteroidaceae bacterium]